MNYRLLALDLDGTVMDADLVISDAVRRAVAAATERGVIVTLATGRMFFATLPYAQRLGVRDPLICYQGALVRHPITNEVYSHVTMPGDLAAEALQMLLDDDVFVIAYIDERLCIARRRDELDFYLKMHPEGAEIVVDPALPARAAAAPPTKLLIVAEPPVVEQTLARLTPRFAGSLSLVRSHRYFGELTAPNISKGAALATLAERLQIPREQVMAIGDQENDLPMITWARLGLAVGNAVESVRAAAAAVLPSVREDGVAYAIERYLLKGS